MKTLSTDSNSASLQVAEGNHGLTSPAPSISLEVDDGDGG